MYKGKPKIKRKGTAKVRNIKIKTKKSKNVSFAQLQSMDMDNMDNTDNNNMPVVTPEFGNSQERTSIGKNDSNNMLKPTIKLDQELLSNNSVHVQKKAEDVASVSYSSHNLKNHKESSLKGKSNQNSINIGSVYSKKISQEKKSKSVVHSKKLKHHYLMKNHFRNLSKDRPRTQYNNSNSIFVRNLRKRKERKSLLHNRSTSKKRRNTKFFEFNQQQVFTQPDKISDFSPTRRDNDFHLSQQNNPIQSLDARFQSNPRTPKSRFSKKNLNKKANLNSKELESRHRRTNTIESKRYMNFDPNKQELFDSNVMNTGHLSASQNIPTTQINGQKTKNSLIFGSKDVQRKTSAGRVYI